MITKPFACYSFNEEEKSNSSSGGIYPLIAGEVLSDGGVIYAACYDDNLNVFHKLIDSKDGIHNSQGSKYVQSSLSTTFRSIISRLRDGEEVLFVGTPCITASTKYNKKREEFFERLKGFITNVDDLTKTSLISKVKNKWLNLLRLPYGYLSSAQIMSPTGNGLVVAA